MPSQDEDIGIAGDCLRGRASRQSNLSVSIRDQVLIQRSHAGIWILLVLPLHVPRRHNGKNQGEYQKSTCGKSLSVHLFS
jgi:hypothetical protein